MSAQGITESSRRRTFAIISHPDAGKTTLTEKLLLFSGAIQLAGFVRAKKKGASTRSDWMKIEQERGISVTTSVMTFEYKGNTFNLLDTPGHEDFADDTYRTLTAADFAIMVVDGVKGIEPRTLKLCEICRLRNIPIITFINKMDRETRDPFEVLDEIESSLALDTTPLTWPIGAGKSFAGTWSLTKETINKKNLLPEVKETKQDLRDAASLLPENERKAWIESARLAGHAYRCFETETFLQGHQTPVFFGSALNSFGIKDLLEGLFELGPSPRPRKTNKRIVNPEEKKMTAFVFRIQANMDPNHRDRIAFFRICSGKLERGMKARLVRADKNITIATPHFFFAQSRVTANEAFPGDVVGISNHGNFRIGDTLTEGEDLQFQGMPDFAPEILRRIRTTDSMKAKKLKDALLQMAEEGMVQLFLPENGSSAIAGVIGALQLDVLRERLNHEYHIPTEFETTRYGICRWIESSDATILKNFIETHYFSIARDFSGKPVFLAENLFSLNYEANLWKKIDFKKINEH